MQFNVSLSPPQSEFQAKPGATIIQAYEVTNNSDETIYLSTSVASWTPQGNSGDVQYLPSNPDHLRFSLSNADLNIGDSFALAPNTHRQLVLKISTATDSPQIDNYFTFFVSKLASNPNSSDSSSQISAQIGSHVLLSLAQKEPTPKSEIKNFQITPLIKDVFLTPITFKADINNLSSSFFKTFGSLEITKNDKPLRQVSLEPLNVLAGHSRAISPITLNPPFWPGVYQAKLSLDASASGASKSQSFYVFPFSPLALALLIFLLITLFGRLKHRK